MEGLNPPVLERWSDMVNTATSDIEQFLAANGVQCDKLAARITLAQCATNRQTARRRETPGTLWHCLRCDGLPGAAGTEARPRRGRRPKAAPAVQVETPAVNNPRSPWRFNPERQRRQTAEDAAIPADKTPEIEGGGIPSVSTES